MLVIRLKRIGKKHQPTYRVVVAEHSNSPSGAFVSDLGFYNPHTKTFKIETDKAVEWMNKGAKPSNTVARLLEKDKVKHKSVVVIKYNKKPKSTKEEETAKPAPAPAENTEAPEAEVAETPEASEAPEAEAAPEAETEKVEETVEDLSSEASAKEETPATDEKADLSDEKSDEPKSDEPTDEK